MNNLAFYCLKLVRWTGWLLLPLILAFLATGYAMSSRYGMSVLADERTALAPRHPHYPARAAVHLSSHDSLGLDPAGLIFGCAWRRKPGGIDGIRCTGDRKTPRCRCPLRGHVERERVTISDHIGYEHDLKTAPHRSF